MSNKETKSNLEKQFEDIEPTKNILAGQEGLIRRPVFEGEFGKDQKFKGYEIEPVRVKSVYAKEDQMWVKFEPLQGGDGFNTRIDNAYQQFKNTKEMSQEEIDKAEWMKARNKLDSPAFVQKMIHQGKSIDDLMKTAGYTKDRFEKKASEIETPSLTQVPSMTQANQKRAKSKSTEKSRDQSNEIPF